MLACLHGQLSLLFFAVLCDPVNMRSRTMLSLISILRCWETCNWWHATSVLERFFFLQNKPCLIVGAAAEARAVNKAGKYALREPGGV
jgi:hypothetical protein